MDRRRNGLIALVVLVTAVAALIYYETRDRGSEPTTAFAPAQSADESVAPSDTPIVPPEELAAVPSDEAQSDVAEVAPPVDEMAEDVAEGPAEPEAPADPETDVAMVDPAEDEPAAAGETAAPPVVD
ncbi:MAG: hypothetical protein WD626_05775, partial [Bauldia sp.]